MYVVGTHEKHLSQALLISTHNKHFWRSKKNINTCLLKKAALVEQSDLHPTGNHEVMSSITDGSSNIVSWKLI